MGFEALFGGCEHCKSKNRGKGNDLKVLIDPGVSKKTEVIDVFIQASDNSIDGIHKNLGFPHFEYRTRICKDCLERYETTDELFDKLNSKSSRKWRHDLEGVSLDLQIAQILIVFLDRGNQYEILTKKSNKVAS